MFALVLYLLSLYTMIKERCESFGSTHSPGPRRRRFGCLDNNPWLRCMPCADGSCERLTYDGRTSLYFAGRNDLERKAVTMNFSLTSLSETMKKSSSTNHPINTLYLLTLRVNGCVIFLLSLS